MLGVCGGYQLLGNYYALGEDRIEGVGLLDVETVRVAGPRLIGNIAIEVDLGEVVRRRPRACSPASRTTAGARRCSARSSRSVACCAGNGNDGASGFEGARSGNTIGTYLHGPLLPKNVWFADWLIARALGVDAEPRSSRSIGRARAARAHLSARRAAGV